VLQRAFDSRQWRRRGRLEYAIALSKGTAKAKNEARRLALLRKAASRENKNSRFAPNSLARRAGGPDRTRSEQRIEGWKGKSCRQITECADSEAEGAVAERQHRSAKIERHGGGSQRGSTPMAEAAARKGWGPNDPALTETASAWATTPPSVPRGGDPEHPKNRSWKAYGRLPHRPS